MRLHNVVLLVLVLQCIYVSAYAQDSSLYARLHHLPGKLFTRINAKSVAIERQLDKQTEKYLARLEKQEKKLQRKLWKKDSAAAKALFNDIPGRYSQLRETASAQSIYSGHLDSMQVALRFLQRQPSLPLNSRYQTVLNNYGQLQGKLNHAAAIKQQLKERQQYLKQQLQKFGLVKQFKKFERDVYYYRAQVDEYRQLLDNPSKLEAKLLQIAGKIPAFKDFFSKNSLLASMFRMPGNDPVSSVTPIAGLQTRSSVQQAMVQRLGTGPDVSRAMQQNIQSAQAQIGQLKEKITKLGGYGSDMDMPDFKPNSQKVKTFWKRIELGANVQSIKSNSFLPVTSDLALTAGYKINDKSVAGIGVSYKLGWGQGIRNIRITHEGIGLRSFLDVKLKGSFYASGGYEQNYRASFNRVEQLRKLDAWQQSALLGLSKKYRINKKFKGNMQLLYDFLHARQAPAAQPVVFRLGYSF